MYQICRKISWLIFIAWIRLSQFLGLLLLDFNTKSCKFEFWRHSSIYCITLGCVNCFLFFYSVFSLAMTLYQKYGGLNFAGTVSVTNQVFQGIFIAFSYQQLFKNRYKLQNAFNRFVIIFKHFGEVSVENCMEKCRKVFFVSILVKLPLLLNSLFSLYIISGESFNVIFLFITYPTIVSLTSCNQFYQCVLITRYLLSTINDRVKKLNSVLTKESRDFQLEIEWISMMHTKLFEFMRDSTSIFGVLVSIEIFIQVLTITIAGFQTCSTLLFMSVIDDNSINYLQLFCLGMISVWILSFGLLFQIKLCVSTMNEVKNMFFFHNIMQTKILLLGCDDPNKSGKTGRQL